MNKQTPDNFARSMFASIELFAILAQRCRDFFKDFICTEVYGSVRKHTENAAPQRGCEVAKLVLCSEDVKTAALPPYEVPLPGIGRAKGCVSGRTGKFAQSLNTPLFFKALFPIRVDNLQQGAAFHFTKYAAFLL